ncbi:MAG: head-tail connector protein [Roseovarius sp.]|uniref:head-tail connector protein n=1 Tax=Roseovarius sp. TaxID=1486281 RepID=UPI0032ED3F08
MRLTRTSEPQELPVDLATARMHCRVDGHLEDGLIQGFLASATDYLDGPAGMLGRAIISQEWLFELAAWPHCVRLPIEPVQSVSITYIDTNGVEQSLNAANFDLVQSGVSQPTHLVMTEGASLPQLGSGLYPVKIAITAGFGGAADVPKSLKTAIYMLVAHWHEHRQPLVVGEAVSDVPMAVSALLSRWRVML